MSFLVLSESRDRDAGRVDLVEGKALYAARVSDRVIGWKYSRSDLKISQSQIRRTYLVVMVTQVARYLHYDG